MQYFKNGLTNSNKFIAHCDPASQKSR